MVVQKFLWNKVIVQFCVVTDAWYWLPNLKREQRKNVPFIRLSLFRMILWIGVMA